MQLRICRGIVDEFEEEVQKLRSVRKVMSVRRVALALRRTE